MQDLNQQLARVLKQKERETGKCTLQEWEQERLLLKEELESSKVKVRGYAVSVKPRELLGTHRCYGISTPVPSCACSVKADLPEEPACSSGVGGKGGSSQEQGEVCEFVPKTELSDAACSPAFSSLFWALQCRPSSNPGGRTLWLAFVTLPVSCAEI